MSRCGRQKNSLERRTSSKLSGSKYLVVYAFLDIEMSIVLIVSIKDNIVQIQCELLAFYIESMVFSDTCSSRKCRCLQSIACVLLQVKK